MGTTRLVVASLAAWAAGTAATVSTFNWHYGGRIPLGACTYMFEQTAMRMLPVHLVPVGWGNKTWYIGAAHICRPGQTAPDPSCGPDYVESEFMEAVNGTDNFACRGRWKGLARDLSTAMPITRYLPPGASSVTFPLDVDAQPATCEAVCIAGGRLFNETTGSLALSRDVYCSNVRHAMPFWLKVASLPYEVAGATFVPVPSHDMFLLVGGAGSGSAASGNIIVANFASRTSCFPSFWSVRPANLPVAGRMNPAAAWLEAHNVLVVGGGSPVVDPLTVGLPASSSTTSSSSGSGSSSASPASLPSATPSGSGSGSVTPAASASATDSPSASMASLPANATATAVVEGGARMLEVDEEPQDWRWMSEEQYYRTLWATMPAVMPLAELGLGQRWRNVTLPEPLTYRGVGSSYLLAAADPLLRHIPRRRRLQQLYVLHLKGDDDGGVNDALDGGGDDGVVSGVASEASGSYNSGAGGSGDSGSERAAADRRQRRVQGGDEEGEPIVIDTPIWTPVPEGTPGEVDHPGGWRTQFPSVPGLDADSPSASVSVSGSPSSSASPASGSVNSVSASATAPAATPTASSSSWQNVGTAGEGDEQRGDGVQLPVPSQMPGVGGEMEPTLTPPPPLRTALIFVSGGRIVVSQKVTWGAVGGVGSGGGSDGGDDGGLDTLPGPGSIAEGSRLPSPSTSGATSSSAAAPAPSTVSQPSPIASMRRARRAVSEDGGEMTSESSLGAASQMWYPILNHVGYGHPTPLPGSAYFGKTNAFDGSLDLRRGPLNADGVPHAAVDAAATVVLRQGRWPYVLAVDLATGVMWRGTPLDCQQPYTCPTDMYSGPCSLSPFDSQCVPCSACPPGSYESAPCRSYANRVCSPCTVCSGSFVQVAPCSATKDTQCDVGRGDGATPSFHPGDPLDPTPTRAPQFPPDVENGSSPEPGVLPRPDGSGGGAGAGAPSPDVSLGVLVAVVAAAAVGCAAVLSSLASRWCGNRSGKYFSSDSVGRSGSRSSSSNGNGSAKGDAARQSSSSSAWLMTSRMAGVFVSLVSHLAAAAVLLSYGPQAASAALSPRLLGIVLGGVVVVRLVGHGVAIAWHHHRFGRGRSGEGDSSKLLVSVGYVLACWHPALLRVLARYNQLSFGKGSEDTDTVSTPKALRMAHKAAVAGQSSFVLSSCRYGRMWVLSSLVFDLALAAVVAAATALLSSSGGLRANSRYDGAPTWLLIACTALLTDAAHLLAGILELTTQPSSSSHAAGAGAGSNDASGSSVVVNPLTTGASSGNSNRAKEIVAPPDGAMGGGNSDVWARQSGGGNVTIGPVRNMLLAAQEGGANYSPSPSFTSVSNSVVVNERRVVLSNGSGCGGSSGFPHMRSQPVPLPLAADGFRLEDSGGSSSNHQRHSYRVAAAAGGASGGSHSTPLVASGLSSSSPNLSLVASGGAAGGVGDGGSSRHSSASRGRQALTTDSGASPQLGVEAGAFASSRRSSLSSDSSSSSARATGRSEHGLEQQSLTHSELQQAAAATASAPLAADSTVPPSSSSSSASYVAARLREMFVTSASEEGRRLARQESFFFNTPWLLPAALEAVRASALPDEWLRILAVLEEVAATMTSGAGGGLGGGGAGEDVGAGLVCSVDSEPTGGVIG